MDEKTPLKAISRRSFLAAAGAAVACPGRGRQTLHVVPNFHPAVMGWLAPYSVERNYCLYSYLDHQDHAIRDAEYRYVFSEIPHLITMLERHPARVSELERLIGGGKAELVNAFVVEPTVNLSGGEALVMQGVLGLAWYGQVMRLRPRHAWMIDICGWHEQMAQIVKGLGLETFVYCRYNPTSPPEAAAQVADPMESVHWIESPDGTRTLAVNPGHYSEALREVMLATEALPREEVLKQIGALVERQQARFPKGAPLVAFAGQADYSLPFLYKKYPRELLEIWEASRPGVALRFSTFSQWYDEFRRRNYPLKTVRSGSRIYGWTAFWVSAPPMKQRFRRAEHLLAAAEALAAVSSLRRNTDYPAQQLWNAWLLVALLMDRNSLWGAAVHAVWEHPKSWDIRDRFDTLEQIARRAVDSAFTGAARGEALAVFNPVNWRRLAPSELRLPPGRIPAEGAAQLLEDGQTALVELPAVPLGCASVALKPGAPAPSQVAALPPAIETDFYTARVDPVTGALVSLRLKPSAREILGGPANDVVAEQRGEKHAKQVFGHEIPRRPDRVPVRRASDATNRIRVWTGPVVTIVESVCPFLGGTLRRLMRFHARTPRIDFVTEMNNLPDGIIASALFPLAGTIGEVRRAIPYGFSHGAWPAPTEALPGQNRGIVPVIRWSHYTIAEGSGVALLDRGVTGRELDQNTVVVLLHNTFRTYYWDTNCRWTTGDGLHRFEYALLAHDGDWRQARVPQMAFEYNSPLLAAPGRWPAEVEGSAVETSENLIVEALRRVEDEIEVRAVEALGAAGEAWLRISLPHTEAAWTNLTGEQRTPAEAGRADEYRLTVRPQQIVTLRLKTARSVGPITALRSFDPIVPEHKRAATRGFDRPELKGHPPRDRGEY